jgi:glycosyltransferase involved in cell wall biosynthesis
MLSATSGNPSVETPLLTHHAASNRDRRADMRIGVFMHAYLPSIGGAQISAHSLANSLVNLGNDVTVYASNRSVDECKTIGWQFSYDLRPVSSMLLRTCLRGGRPGIWAASRYVSRLIKADQLDVVQLVGAWPWIPMAGGIKSATGIPVVLRVAGDDIQIDESVDYGFRRSRRAARMLDGSFTDVDLAIAISETVVEEYEAVGISRERTVTIPPGVDLDAFDKEHVDPVEIRKNFGLPQDRRIIISVGRNHPKKAFAELIEALPSLNAEGDKYAVVVVGKDTDQLLPVAHALGVSGSFFAVDVVAEGPEPSGGTFPSQKLIQLYKASDLFVYPSHVETYANVAIEAMAAGIPVIVADAPGSRDTVVHGVDGLMVPVGNPEQIASTVLELDRNPDLTNRLIQGGRDKVERQDWDDIAAAYEAAYQQQLTGNRRDDAQ